MRSRLFEREYTAYCERVTNKALDALRAPPPALTPTAQEFAAMRKLLTYVEFVKTAGPQEYGQQHDSPEDAVVAEMRRRDAFKLKTQERRQAKELAELLRRQES